jgi:hypothetical protein
MFIVALFQIAKSWNQPRWSSMDEWIKKLSHIHTAIEKNEIMLFTKMNLNGDHHVK